MTRVLQLTATAFLLAVAVLGVLALNYVVARFAVVAVAMALVAWGLWGLHSRVRLVLLAGFAAVCAAGVAGAIVTLNSLPSSPASDPMGPEWVLTDVPGPLKGDVRYGAPCEALGERFGDVRMSASLAWERRLEWVPGAPCPSGPGVEYTGD